MDIIDVKSSAEARGSRLKKLRMLAGLSRKAMEKEYRISASTLQSWEDGKAGGLTPKGSRRVIEALSKEGVVCSLDWLLHGIGIGPKVADRVYHGFVGRDDEEHKGSSKVTDSMPDDAAISKELLAFRHANADAMDILILGDEMSPEYLPGDYVAGRRRYHKTIEQTVGLDCIVETVMGDTLLRRVRRGSREGVYTLLCTNSKTVTPLPVLYDVEVLSSAPVTWRRRKDPV
jgi:transcriptional regulator with XRE-family HTH domain